MKTPILLLMISLSFSMLSCGSSETEALEEKIEKLNASKKALQEKEDAMDEALEELENN